MGQKLTPNTIYEESCEQNIKDLPIRVQRHHYNIFISSFIFSSLLD